MENNYIKYSYIVRNRWECIDYIGKKSYITLNREIIYYLDYQNKNEYIIIPKNYIFDFNSSPCFWHCIVDRDEFMIALIHDYLYSKEWKIHIKDENNLSSTFVKLMKYWNFTSNWNFNYSRKFTDRIWLYWAIEEALKIEKKNKTIKACIWYLFIRIFGFRKFK